MKDKIDANKVNTESNQAIIDNFKSKVVAITYSDSLSRNKKHINKVAFLKKAREVGKNLISDDTSSSRAIPASL